jgi:hypothetical protein
MCPALLTAATAMTLESHPRVLLNRDNTGGMIYTSRNSMPLEYITDSTAHGAHPTICLLFCADVQPRRSEEHELLPIVVCVRLPALWYRSAVASWELLRIFEEDLSMQDAFTCTV